MRNAEGRICASVVMMGLEPHILKTPIYTHNTLLLCKTKTSPITTPIYASNSQVNSRKGKFQNQRDGSVSKSACCTSLMTPVQYLDPLKKAGCSGILDHSQPSSSTGLYMLAATPGFHVCARDATVGPHACGLNHLPKQAHARPVILLPGGWTRRMESSRPT